MRVLESEIYEAMRLAAEYETASDQAFAAGDPINGSKYFRWSILIYQLAGSLERRDAVARLW